MPLFNYEKCEICKNEKETINMTLTNILPENICKNICDYNVFCKYCTLLLDDERKFDKHKNDKNTSKIELQIRFFTVNNCPPFELRDNKKVNVSKMNAIVDNSQDDDLMYKKVMKSYFNGMYRYFKRDILPLRLSAQPAEVLDKFD